MMKTTSILLGSSLLVVGLMLGNGSSTASAVEMFTNFNNGMELGFRPYGIPEFPPVRYHSWQPQRWYDRHGMTRPCGLGQVEDYEGGPFGRPNTVVPPPSVPGNQSLNEEPIRLRAEPTASITPSLSDHNDIDFQRGESFMPQSR